MGVTLQPTGVDKLDEVLNGGLPFGSTVVVSGAPGTGKTVLAQQWLFAGYEQFGEPGLYLSLTESNDKSLRNLRAFGFFDESALEPHKVHFSDFRAVFAQLGISTTGGLRPTDLDQVVDVIRHMADATGTKRVVIDSLTAITQLMPSSAARREFVFRLGNNLAHIGATILLIVEASHNRGDQFEVEDFIADGIITITNVQGQQSMVRRLNVLKLRGSNYRSGPVHFEILPEGLRIYPKIPNYSLIARTDFKDRVKTGVPGLDALMGGGLPRGHIILLGGNTGTGKTSIASQFLNTGLKEGSGAVYVALEESVTQIKKTAAQHSWDFETPERAGRLAFVTTELIDLYPDRLLYDILSATKRTQAQRVVIDSISSLENSAFDNTRIREFLLQLLAYFKSQGITCMLTYLTPEMFGAGPAQLLSATSSTELGLSSMVDGIILLRYVERNQTVRRHLNILKLRGSPHDKQIVRYEVDREGVIVLGGGDHD